MRRLAALLFCAAWCAFAGAPALGQSSFGNTTGNTVTTCGTPSPYAAWVAGRAGSFSIDTNGRLCITGTITFTPSGTQDVNLAQVAGATALAGNGATGTGSLRITIANDNTLPTGWASAANQTAVQSPVAPATATATKSMLLGAQATTAAVNPTNGQQGALSSDTNNNLLVSAGGAPNLAIAQVSVATSDTAVIAARALRRSVTVQQVTGTQNVFCNQTTATAGNGVVLPAVVGASFTFNTTSAIRCIAITGAQTVAVAETF